MPITHFDDHLSFTLLKSYYFTRTGNSLLVVMKLSAINNGATIAQSNLLDNITDSFTIGTISYRTILNIPYSNEVNLTLNPLVGSGWVNICSKFTSINFSSTPFDTIINYDSSAAYVQSHPTWLVSFRSKEHSEDPWVEWMPFRRCSCPPSQRPDGTFSSMGFCSGTDLNYIVCGRAVLSGGCEGGKCASSFDYDIIPPFN